jgi:hypothetical protein
MIALAPALQYVPAGIELYTVTGASHSLVQSVLFKVVKFRTAVGLEPIDKIYVPRLTPSQGIPAGTFIRSCENIKNQIALNPTKLQLAVALDRVVIEEQNEQRQQQQQLQQVKNEKKKEDMMDSSETIVTFGTGTTSKTVSSSSSSSSSTKRNSKRKNGSR